MSVGEGEGWRHWWMGMLPGLWWWQLVPKLPMYSPSVGEGGGGHRCDHSKCLHKTVGSIGRGMSVLLNSIKPMGRHYVCADSMLLLERLVCVCVCLCTFRVSTQQNSF